MKTKLKIYRQSKIEELEQLHLMIHHAEEDRAKLFVWMSDQEIHTKINETCEEIECITSLLDNGEVPQVMECAWCNEGLDELSKVMMRFRDRIGLVTSHGICKPCDRRMEKEETQLIKTMKNEKQ